MKALVLDCSVAASFAFKDERTAYSRDAMAAVGASGALVPALWPLEVANTLLTAERRGRIARADSLRFIHLLRQLPIHTAPAPDVQSIEPLYTLAANAKLTAYDAAYLHLALAEGLTLATQDAALRRAARKAGAKLFQP